MGHFKILILDDDQVDREATQRIFENHNTTTCSRPEEAFGKLVKKRFDVFITDINMFPITGIDMADICRIISPSTKICISTGVPIPPDAYKCLNKEYYVFLKDNLDELKETVESWKS